MVFTQCAYGSGRLTPTCIAESLDDVGDGKVHVEKRSEPIGKVAPPRESIRLGKASSTPREAQ
jgi:hypothetical protein